MKKVGAVFDGLRFSKATLDFSISIAKEAHAQLTGIFLDDFVYRSYNMAKVVKEYKDYSKKLELLDEKDKQKRDAAVELFEKTCKAKGVDFTVHRTEGIAINDLKHQSIFTDVMIISNAETFTKYKEKAPTRFMRDLLADVQCPVIVVPNFYRPIEKAIFLYDGGPSSVYAAKMYSYLFQKSPVIPVEVLTINEPKAEAVFVPDKQLLKSFIKQHYPKAKFVMGKGNAEDQILRFLTKGNGTELVVLGAYRRSEISRWFKESMADVLMRELQIPLFIAHNK